MERRRRSESAQQFTNFFNWRSESAGSCENLRAQPPRSSRASLQRPRPPWAIFFGDSSLRRRPAGTPPTMGAMEQSFAAERRARRWLGVRAALLILACGLGMYR